MLVIRAEQQAALAEAAFQRYLAGLRALSRRCFPERTASLDERALDRLLRAAVARARALGFGTERQASRFAVLTVALGAGFEARHAWARRILADPAPITAERRSRLLMDAAKRVDPDEEPAHAG